MSGLDLSMMPKGRSEVFSAALDGDEQALAGALSRGGDPNEMSPMMCKALVFGTPLMQAAALGHVGCARILAPLTTPNIHDKFGRTALMRAAMSSSSKIVELLSQVENPLGRDFGGDMPMFMIGRGEDNWRKQGQHTEAEQIECAKHLLLAGGADALAPRENGETALMAAIANASDGLALFLAQHCDIRALDGEGRTALMWAAFSGRETLVAALAPHSDIWAVDKNGLDAKRHAYARQRAAGDDVGGRIAAALMSIHEKNVLSQTVGGAPKSPRAGRAL